ncbi:helix-turn-helix transcriptional regulator [Prescottella agglutinans]|uniref:helix-turn-helix transcriptional regulator n=1 Tax=Prescottella agglutinans TaxID=1644129 RepID=UPI003D99F4EB
MSVETTVRARSWWDGMLTLTPGAVLYRGTGGDAALHAHHAVQVMISLDEPFELELAEDRHRATAAVVPSGLPHRLHCASRRLLLMLVEPFGPRGRGLGLVGEHRLGQEFEEVLERVATQHADDVDAVSVIDSLIGATAPDGLRESARLSDPVRTALRYLERDGGSQPTLAGAAAAAHISPSRLTHRFTREVGIPFRRYVLWVRLRTVAERMTFGDNLTRAAVTAGFSDSSHLSRVFKSNFGLSPSALLGMTVDRDVWPESTS